MKLILLISLALVASCASNSTKKVSTDTKEAAKTETVKAKEIVKKEMAKADAKTSDSIKTCTIGKVVRTIEVKKSGSGCEVLYTKDGETNSVASAQNDLGHCSSIQDRITGKLSDAGFNCK